MVIVTSAPGKVILFGEHGVNRRQTALATAVDRRVLCRVRVHDDHRYSFSSGEEREAFSRAELLSFKAEIDALRAAEALDAIRERARRDFFAPARYVLGHAVEQVGGPGLDVEWRSQLPVGSGLGSGAAASAALVLAALRAAGERPEPSTVAHMAWQGDVIAHGGVASGLDSGACALGGLISYTLAEGPQAIVNCGLGSRQIHNPERAVETLPLVIGDTRVRANTSEVNTRVRRWLAEHPTRMHLFEEMGLLVRHAMKALTTDGDSAGLVTLGHLMNLNQLLLEKLGVSCPEIERLVEAALGAGALGAKLSGSGGGGIIIALTEPGQQEAVAASIEVAGGVSTIAATAAPGVRLEPEETWTKWNLQPRSRAGGSSI
jgi:mevalonate kinase